MPRVLQQSTEPEKGIGTLVETQLPKEESKTLCIVLSCHIGHGMTRTNQKCNTHLQSMSHVTWMNLNVSPLRPCGSKTESVAVRFHVQLLILHVWIQPYPGSLAFLLVKVNFVVWFQHWPMACFFDVVQSLLQGPPLNTTC